MRLEVADSQKGAGDGLRAGGGRGTEVWEYK